MWYTYVIADVADAVTGEVIFHAGEQVILASNEVKKNKSLVYIGDTNETAMVPVEVIVLFDSRLENTAGAE